MSTDPFSGPAAASGVQWKDHLGELLLFRVHAHETGINTSLGEKDAIRADVVVLDGDRAGEEHTDILVFPKVLQGQLKPRIGGMVLGRLGQGNAKTGQNAPWQLSEPTDADRKIGLAYIEKQNSSKVPF